MNDHNPAPSSDGAASACPSIVGHTMTVDAPGPGKTMYDVFRLIAVQRRRIRGAHDAPDAGDEACA